jgi:iron only hydrogenase large subunit-like protein
MNHQHPIFTARSECQDCCACVRHCPVKAIRVENGSATVMAERCIACGHCVKVCPVHAKRVRDDLGRLRQLLRSGRTVVASLAPSYVSEFEGCTPAQLVQALKRLGFAAVSETALGAQEVSAAVADELRDPTPRILLSSACPVVVDLVYKYLPAYGQMVTNLASPLLVHCRLLRREFGPDVAIVFIGPCIAKKLEADRYPDLLELAVTFTDLRLWLHEEHLNPRTLPTDASDHFVPQAAAEGALYPVDGGMIAGIKAQCSVADAGFMALSGVETVLQGLQDLESLRLQRPLFLELLGCAGGCINGPQAEASSATVLKRVRVISRAASPAGGSPRPPTVDARLDRRLEPIAEHAYSERQMREALARVGKHTGEDELNCSGCGYASCRGFAQALLAGMTEPTSCLSYMRKLAQKKANALIQTMPSGVVIVDAALNVVECNRRFAEVVGGDAGSIYDARPGLEGASLERLAPFLAKLFHQVLENGEDIPDRDLKHGGRVFTASVFSIERSRIVGGILRDITEPAVQRDQVIGQAQKVIRRQMETVQKIAYLLGENAAESQVSLNAIIESFAGPEAEEKDGGDGR